MVSPGSLVGLGLIVVLHTVIAAVATRFFRLRLQTRWGSLVYTVLLVPVALVGTTLFLSGALGIGDDVGGVDTLVLLVVVLPLTLGYTIDVFWMPAPEEYDLPERSSERG